MEEINANSLKEMFEADKDKLNKMFRYPHIDHVGIKKCGKQYGVYEVVLVLKKHFILPFNSIRNMINDYKLQGYNVDVECGLEMKNMHVCPSGNYLNYENVTPVLRIVIS